MSTSLTSGLLFATIVSGSASCARDPRSDVTLILLVVAAIVALSWWRRASAPAVAVAAGLTAMSSHDASAGPTEVERDAAPSVERARATAEADGFKHVETTFLAGRTAAMIRYSGPSIPRMARIDFVSPTGAPITIEDSIIGLPPASGGGKLWDLHGDGARFVLVDLTSCGANCSPERHRVLELRDGVWAVPAAQLERPAEGRDVDGDRIPDFPATLAHLIIAGCPRVTCGATYHIGATVEGLESWDGQRYTRELRSFVPYYASRLASARRDAEAHRANKGPPDPCPVSEVQTAAEVYLYSRMLGATELAAGSAADAVMAGRSTSTCGEPYHDVRDWPALRRELASVKLPGLTRERSTARK